MALVQRRANEVVAGREVDGGFRGLVQNRKVLKMCVTVADGTGERNRCKQLFEGLVLVFERDELRDALRDTFVRSAVAAVRAQAIQYAKILAP